MHMHIYMYISSTLTEDTQEVAIRPQGGQGPIYPTDTMASDDLEAHRNRALEARILTS